MYKWRYFKTVAKNTCVCFNDVIELMAMKARLKMKNRSQRYDINRPTIIFIIF